MKAICVEHWDTDRDGELSKAEAAAVTTLIDSETNQSVFYNKNITSFDEVKTPPGIPFGEIGWGFVFWGNCRGSPAFFTKYLAV